MLSEPVLLPFGLVIPLGTFLLAFKYVYSFAYCLWALAVARSQSSIWFVSGIVGLGLLGLAAITTPLERPYGLDPESELLPSVADSMVVAAGASPFDGWRVESANRHPAWSAFLAALSGFDPSRILAFLPWVGVVSIVLFASLTFLALRSFETGPPFAVFFAVLLSSSQLDFLDQPLIYWQHVILVEPHRALALPLVLVAGLSSLSPSRSRAALGACALGALAYLEPTYWLLTAFAMGATRRFLPLASGIALGLPGILRLSSEASASASWSLSANLLMPSPVPFLALVALVAMYRARRPAHQYGLVLAAGSLAAALLGGIASPLVDPAAVHVLLRFLESILAGYGFALVLEFLERSTRLRRQSLVAAGLIVLLPWSVFYWWQPRTMDPPFERALAPISPRLENLAGWVRANTPEDAVFFVSPGLGAWLPAFTGRRVLVSDEPDALLAAQEETGVTHVAVLRVDLDRRPDLREALSSSTAVKRVHSVARWVTVYAIAGETAPIGR